MPEKGNRNFLGPAILVLGQSIFMGIPEGLLGLELLSEYG